VAELAQVVFRRARDALALACGNAGSRTSEGCAAAQADFDEHQRVAIPRDQIDFATSATVVAPR